MRIVVMLNLTYFCLARNFKKNKAMETGFLYINKPAGVSSFWMVGQIRKITGIKRVGHAGTLDPFATGLLIIAVGRESTKQLGQFLKKDKVYRAILKLGYMSSTGDTEGEITEVDLSRQPSLIEIKKVLELFTSNIEQMPPQYSALKIGGVPAYKLARRGEKVELKKRSIVIHDLRILSYTYPRLEIEASVSSGTYVRVLAEDIGKALGVGAYLTGLERTSIDGAHLKDAVSLDQLSEDNWQDFLHNS